MALEFDKMLTISTAHISESTRDLLDKEPTKNNMCLNVYPKSEYGWFIYIAPNLIENCTDIPSDLKSCIDFAHQHNCTILCIDCDAETVEGLTQYD